MHQLFDALFEGVLGDGAVSEAPLVIGVGSDNGDDRAGWTVIERLYGLGWSADMARVAWHPSELLDWCDSRRELIVCDACVGSGNEGHHRRWTWPTDRIPASPPRGSHDLGLSYVLELGRTLDRVPVSVSVWTIEGRNWRPKTPLAPAVRAAARIVADEIHASVAGNLPLA